MLSQLSSAAKVVGVKQSKKVIRDGSATHAFIAADAERRITAPIYELCEAHNLEARSALQSAQQSSPLSTDFNGTNSR